MPPIAVPPPSSDALATILAQQSEILATLQARGSREAEFKGALFSAAADRAEPERWFVLAERAGNLYLRLRPK